MLPLTFPPLIGFFRSIRFKIVLWYMLVLALTLSLFSFILYQRYRRDLYTNLDYKLRLKAEGIAISIDTYWETEKLEMTMDGDKGGLYSKINNLNFIKIAQRWVKEKTDDPLLVDVAVQICDPHGHIIAATSQLRPDRPPAAVAAAEHGRPALDEVEVKTAEREKPIIFRRYLLPVTEGGKTAYLVMAASPLEPLWHSLANLRLILLFMLPVTVFLTGIAGAFLARITLRPVDRIISTIHQITAENLQLRLSLPETRDEISRLADTFNGMLGRLEEALLTQRQFLQDIAHELKTPLAVLKGELSLALKRVRSGPEYEAVLQSGLEEVNRIIRIVEDLLMLARFESRALTLEKKPVDLVPLVTGVTDDLRILAEQKKMTLTVRSPGPVLVAGDPEKLRRLVGNIVDNAIKYTGEGGRVSVEVAAGSGQARIRVQDTGVGIPAAELPRIFERFYQVDKSRSSGGFGLGLSIAQSIALAHGGRITVESQGQPGSIFTVSLPSLPAA